MDRPYNVLFLGTRNCGRSILGEAALNRAGKGRFKAYSAGSLPSGELHPATYQVLENTGLPADGLRSKSWQEFAAPGAPRLDFVFSVSPRGEGEIGHALPGDPVVAHWGIADPVDVEGPDQAKAFEQAMFYLSNRIGLLLALPSSELDEMASESRSHAAAARPLELVH